MRKDLYEVIYMAKKQNLKINYSKIARQFDCDPRTVKRYYESESPEPCVRKKRIIKKVTDDVKEIIEEKYIKFHAPAIAIYNLLKSQGKYTGSYTSIKNFTHNLKDKLNNEATMRFETNPGLQCQIDWKESLKLINKHGQEFVVNIFLGILGYSRKKYIQLTLDKTQPTLFKCLTNMFKEFKGVPNELLFDNMRTVVDRSRTQFQEAQYNIKLYSFSKDAGFIPKSCIAFRPQTKGKVETVAKIMNRLKVYNNEFETINELDLIVRNLMKEINSEINQTTKERADLRFLKEKEYLNPEPKYEILDDYFSTKPLIRKVPNDALITFESRRYSVPPNLIGKTVTVEKDGNNLYIYYNNNFVCKHEISDKIFNYNKDHYIKIAQSSIYSDDDIEKLCEANLEILNKL